MSVAKKTKLKATVISCYSFERKPQTKTHAAPKTRDRLEIYRQIFSRSKQTQRQFIHERHCMLAQFCGV
jgi:putative ubiquitin-RnfH superfamily antitoxin RatB of RatAB toxin-antitoxin module